MAAVPPPRSADRSGAAGDCCGAVLRHDGLDECRVGFDWNLQREATALDGERALVDRDVDVLAGHVRQFGLQDQLMLAVLVDIHRRHPGAG